MSKCDSEIGYRTVQEVFRLFPGTTKSAIAAIGCSKSAMSDWSKGSVPSAEYLVRLHELGADVIWILTGKRSATRCKNCTHGSNISCSNGVVWCSMICRYMKEDGFCSLGERRNDGE